MGMYTDSFSCTVRVSAPTIISAVAAHHDPMLGAMEMFLQRKRGVWIHDNALDLVARADIDALVITPRPIHPQMLVGLGAVLRLELLDQRFDLFRFVARSHQHGVGRRHHDDVFEADDGGEDVVL